MDDVTYAFLHGIYTQGTLKSRDKLDRSTVMAATLDFPPRTKLAQYL